MKESESIKKEILDYVKGYYEATLKEKEISNKITYAGRVYDQEELINLVDASLDFWLTEGKWTKEFESKLCEYLGIKYSLFCNSGSSANLLAFMALTSPLHQDNQIKKGDEVITVACGFPTTVSPIINYGAVTVFVDVDLNTVNIKIEDLEKAISSKTKAVFIAHTLGNPFNISAILEFCKKYRLWLIEDNCDSFGSFYQEHKTGTFGHIGTSSFYPPHHLTTGEGGAVYTDNSVLYRIMKSLRDWGRDCSCQSGQDDKCGNRFNKQYGKMPFGFDHKYIYSYLGYNLKATDLQAAIGCAQMDKIFAFNGARILNRNYLYDNLQELKDYFTFQEATANSTPSWFGFLLTLKDGIKFNRKEIVDYLENNGIQTRMLFAGNITKQPCFDSLLINKDYRIIGNLENTNKIMNDSFWIGVYPGMTQDNLKFMVDKIKEFVNEKKYI